MAAIGALMAAVSVMQIPLWVLCRDFIKEVVTYLTMDSINTFRKIMTTMILIDIVSALLLTAALTTFLYQWACVLLQIRQWDRFEKLVMCCFIGVYALIACSAIGCSIYWSVIPVGSLYEARGVLRALMKTMMSVSATASVFVLATMATLVIGAAYLFRINRRPDAWGVIKLIGLFAPVLIGLIFRIVFATLYDFENDSIIFYLNYLLVQALIVVPLIVLVFLALVAAQKRKGERMFKSSTADSAKALLRVEDNSLLAYDENNVPPQYEA